MKLIQDIFNGGLSEKIRLSTLLVDENGDETGIALDSLLFSCSTKSEFVNSVEIRLKNKAYPFIFIESGDNISYEPTNDWNRMKVSISELFICTTTNHVLLADERDRISFKTILFPIKDALEKEIYKSSSLVKIPTKGSPFSFTQHHSYSTGSSEFSKKLDVLILKDIELLLKIC